MHIRKHIHGEGISDIFKSIGKKLFGKTVKTVAKTAAKTAATKTAEYAGKKAGDKIIELLNKKKTTNPLVQMEPSKPKPIPKQPKVLTAEEVNERVNQILSGGKFKRRMKW